jgi:pimeloyl-ACP methyl ester carboxylesterase
VKILIDPENFKSVQTPVLNIGYGDYGDATAFPIFLLHGFPYEVISFDGVVQPLIDAGYRVLVPYLRGYGSTSFIDPDAPRMAEQAAIGQDVTDFADALGIGQFATAGYDWGNRAACLTSIFHPDRVKAQVAIGGYSVQDTVNTEKPVSAMREAQLWYQWYFNSPQGIVGLAENRRDVVRYLWETWAPEWNYTDEDFNRAAPAFDNPDFVDIVIHSYRHRHKNAPGEERFIEAERRLAEQPRITVPSIVLLSGASGFGRPSTDPSLDQDRFPGMVARRIVEGAGHDLPTQRPAAVADALIELLQG